MRQLLFLLTLFCLFSPTTQADTQVQTRASLPGQCTDPLGGARPPQRLRRFPEIDYSSLGREPTANEIYASRLYVRLTGTTIPFSHPRFRRVVKLIEQGDRIAAARIIVTERNFLDVRVRNFAAPFSSKDFSPREPLNDLQALIIGLTRDELDARLMLTGDIRYSAPNSFGLPRPSVLDNNHYVQFDERGLDFATDLELVRDQWENLDFGAGALTTRTYGKLNYEAGTNRRAVTFAFEAFLCAPQLSWKTRGLPDFYVRRDVDRVVGGDPSTYQNHCRGCHAPMDAMGGAFAKFDFTKDGLVYVRDGVAAKMNQKEEHYPDGHVTSDDSWLNLLANKSSVDFGWRTPLVGTGVNDFGTMMANSFAFSRCMTTKVFAEVCGKSVKAEFPELLDPLATEFEKQGYNLKFLFTKVATLNECISQ